jgi:D-serine deaminase-like pyridoxal phosphate-dependent protein
MSITQPGTLIDDLDTPVLCLDLDVLESNIRRAADVCRRKGVAWRPHCKAHKCPEVARLEVEAGAIGVTCAKLGEAEVMAAAGIRDILIANMLVGRQKLSRLAALCRIADPIVVVDDLAQVDPLSAAMAREGTGVRALIEVDVGLGRVGVSPGRQAVDLAKAVAARPGLVLEGIMGYEGHLLTLADAVEKDQSIRSALAKLVQVRDDLESAGLECPIVSAGGTGSFATTVTCPGITEVQAGGLVLMDEFYKNVCRVEGFEQALFVLTTVVSRPAPERAVIDAGRKTHNAELCPSIVRGRRGLQVTRLSAEHGQLFVSPEADPLQVGDRLELIPGYSDFTCVLHDEFHCMRNGRLEAIWPLAARGKIR